MEINGFINDPLVVKYASGDSYSGKVVRLWLEDKLKRFIFNVAHYKKYAFLTMEKPVRRLINNPSLYIFDIEACRDDFGSVSFERSNVAINIMKFGVEDMIEFKDTIWTYISLGKSVGHILRSLSVDDCAHFLDQVFKITEDYLENRHVYQDAVTTYRHNKEK